MTQRFILAAGCLPAMLLLGATGCSKATSAGQPATAAASSSAVKLASPERRTIRQIHSRVPGYVSDVLVDMNSAVKKGQVLARISVPELEQELQQRKSLLEQANAVFAQARAGAATADALVESSKASIVETEADLMKATADRDFRKIEHERHVMLRKENAILGEIVDEKHNQLRAAQAAVAHAHARISTAKANLSVEQARQMKAKADVDFAKSSIAVANSNVKQADIMLAYSNIVAPFDGIVTQRNVHTGHLIKASNMGSSDPLFVIVRNDRVRVFVDVPETDAKSIFSTSEHGDRATIAHLRVQASRNKEIDAPVTRTSWSLDPANRTLRVEIELPTAGTDLRPGMYAYCSFTIEHAGVWCLPSSSVFSKDTGSFCYRVEDGKAVLTPIRAGVREGDVVQVLAKQSRQPAGATWGDFTGTERFVHSNPSALTEGQQVDLSGP